MAFSDQPPPSLLRIWPLVPLGRWAARLVHRAKDTTDGGLISRRYFIPEDVAWRLGQAYLGMLGLLALPLTWQYLNAFHQNTGTVRYSYDVFGRRVGKHYLGFRSDLPLDLKIILPLTFVLHVIGIVSFIRWLLVSQELRKQNKAP